MRIGTRRCLAMLFLLMVTCTGCAKTVLKLEGETMVARPGMAVPVGGVIVGLGLMAVGALVARKGKSAVKRIAGGAMFLGFGVALAVFSVMQYNKSYVRGDAQRIVKAVTLFDDPKVVELDPLTHVSVHRVRRSRGSAGGPKRRWVTLLWLHRPDGTHEEVAMGGDLNRPVLDHVLTKLAERGVRIEDLRDNKD